MTSILHLDLEQTIITNWNDEFLCNVQKIKSFIDANPDIDRDDVRIFSFAIYDQRDQETFDREIKAMIERVLDVKITAWPSVFEMAEADQQYTGDRWLDADTMGGLDICEFINIRGKHGAFENYVWHTAVDGSRHILIDDLVPHRSIVDHTRGIQIDLINVDKNL
jgi:hypothetical protein